MAKSTAELTIEGTIVATEVVHAIISTGKSITMPTVKITVQHAYVTDIAVSNWELPKVLYLDFNRVATQRPDIGDHIDLMAEIGTARLANADDAAAIARRQGNQYRQILARARSFAKRYAGRRRVDFDRLTADYEGEHITFDEWLVAQKNLLPSSKLLERLQKSLTMIEEARQKELEAETHPVAAAAEVYSIQVHPSGRYPHHDEILGVNVGGRLWEASQADIAAEFLRIEAEDNMG